MSLREAPYSWASVAGQVTHGSKGKAGYLNGRVSCFLRMGPGAEQAASHGRLWHGRLLTHGH